MSSHSSPSVLLYDNEKIAADIEKVAPAVSADIPLPEMPEALFEIFVYLPELFQDRDEERYIGALSLAMRTSYENGLSVCIYAVSHALYDCDLFCSSEIKRPTSR